jgi:hypothetical protein
MINLKFAETAGPLPLRKSYEERLSILPISIGYPVVSCLYAIQLEMAWVSVRKRMTTWPYFPQRQSASFAASRTISWALLKGLPFESSRMRAFSSFL